MYAPSHPAPQLVVTLCPRCFSPPPPSRHNPTPPKEALPLSQSQENNPKLDNINAPALKTSCLPADALLTVLEVGGVTSVRPVASVAPGASVLTSEGYSPIYLFSHYAPGTTSSMIRLETTQGYVVELSALHYVEADGVGPLFAQDVTAGHALSLHNAEGTLGWATVTKTSTVYKRGLFSPFTLRGDLVVASHRNSSAGIVISDQSEWFAEAYLPTRHIPALYQGLLAPVRALFVLDPAWVCCSHVDGVGCVVGGGGSMVALRTHAYCTYMSRSFSGAISDLHIRTHARAHTGAPLPQRDDG